MDYIEKNFEGLTSAFNTSFQMEDKDVEALVNQTEKQVEMINEKKNELINGCKTEVMFKDQTFLEDELKSLIMSTRSMLARLEAEIKIGSKSGYYDSFARLATAVGSHIKELRELNVAVVNIEMEKKRVGDNINNTRKANIILDANSLWELVNKAKSDSQINKIDASFTIEEEDK